MPTVKLGTKAVGSTIKLNLNGSPREFLIMHQGNPSTGMYDASCNGTWVRMKEAYENRQWDSSNNDYANSDVDAWLNGAFLNMLDQDIREQGVKQVKIPYRPGSGYGSNVNTGANGLSRKAFLLGMREMGLSPSYSPNDGVTLAYYSGGGTKVINLNGSPARAWSRSPYVVSDGDSFVCSVEAGGSALYWFYNRSYAVAPALILDSELSVSDDGTVSTNEPPTAPGSISVSGVVASGTATITLTAATDPDGTIASYRYERSVDGGSWTQFADVNSLTQTDSVSGDWGTVAYRACAVDDAGEAGPYATSDTETVNSGWVTIGGPDSALGQRIKPFTLSAAVNVTGATGTPSLTVTCALDGKQVSSQSVAAGSEASIFVDTRVLATGQHTIQMTAEASDYLPANKAWQFSVPMDELPDGGRAEQLWDENQVAIFPRTTSQQVIGKNGLSVQNELDNFEKKFRGLTGHLEHVDTVYLASAGAQTEVPREAGTHYCFTAYNQENNDTPIRTTALIAAGNNTSVSSYPQIGDSVAINADASKFTLVKTGPNPNIIQVSKFVIDAEATVTTNPVALFTALDQPHVLSASGGTSETVTDQTDALQTIIDENENANYYILEDTDGNKYYVASTSIINASTASFTGPVYQDDQATTLYTGRTLNLVNTSDVPSLFTALSNTVYSITTQGTAVSIGSNLNETLLAMIEAQPTWNRYKLTGSDSTTYYVLSQSTIGSDATSAASVYYCTASGTYYTGGTLSFSIPASTLNVNDIVHIKENGTYQDFVVIQKDNPESSKYVGFENGIVLLRKDLHSPSSYDSSNNDYANSDLNTWGNNTYLNSIDESVRNKIKTVKIPYRPGTSGTGVSNGANGLQCKVFFLSTKEVDSTESYSPNEGSVFSYFSGGGDSKRIARYDGQASSWWLRSPNTNVDSYVCLVRADGNVNNYTIGSSYGRRPAFVLSNDAILDENNNVIG